MSNRTETKITIYKTTAEITVVLYEVEIWKNRASEETVKGHGEKRAVLQHTLSEDTR